jgi:uncharacterized protein
VHVGVCRLTLLASHCHSLKEKRAIVRTLKDRVRARFHVPVSEVGGQDTWQRIVLGFAVVGSDRQTVDRTAGEIAAFVERSGLAELVEHERELASYGEGAMHKVVLAGGDDHGDDDWIPDSWKETR